MPEKFENPRFHSEKHQIFSVHTVSKKFENATITVILDLCLRKTRGISRDHRDVIVFEKLRCQIFSVHTKMRSRRFRTPPIWRAVFTKPPFYWRIRWTVAPPGITVEIKLRFQTSPANCERGALENWIGNCSHTEKKYSDWKTPLPLVMFHKANIVVLGNYEF